MGKMTKLEIINKLIGEKVTYDIASQYANALVEYHEASDNIDNIGTIVSHPRTGNIITNPYLEIRTSSEKRLIALRNMVGEDIVHWIWELWEFEIHRDSE